ncbi:hypothetical protein JTZ62_04560 [Mammaliicoccus sciuri]|uniref:hypothetical protein n=1 Tax=Mammaliicoccus sciuri TaxID=1296 RepID=UPI0019D3D0AB|nr:hypothetical protein [Mammaliicoccus sciuri]QSN68430.1 hypothetical protein JTZ62_04560 [Mammaliicoccus sciuri]UIU23171.1 hypothetical protein LLZ87_04570 [Mammaliicoccus sciuri]UIU26076.1 hypothetical protein LLZ92_04570 [Mammaliicoccus sciuri]
MKTTQTNLINKFNELDLNYLDFTGYNEIDEHDNEQTYNLYNDMFNKYIDPILNGLDKINYNSDYVIFNFFVKDNETDTIKGVFYEPQIEIDITNNNYDKEIQSAIELITK